MQTAPPVSSKLEQLSPAEVEAYHREGFHISRGLFTEEDVRLMREKLDGIGRRGVSIANSWEPDLSPEAASDPLKRYPRVLMPHRYDDFSLRMLLHPKVVGVVHDLFGEDPLAAQSMYYFKPPGARGQALHQDDYYLLTEPKACMASWAAIDPSTPENGGLWVVPRSHVIDLQCPQAADPSESFVNHLVPPPPGLQAVPAILQPGDVLFFNGRLIHGSTPNRSPQTWRRSFICHFIPESTAKVSQWCMPLLTRDGRVAEKEANGWGGPCGAEDADKPHIKQTFAP